MTEYPGICQENVKFDEIVCMGKKMDAERLSEARNDADSWLEWYSLTPLQRWYESAKLWQFYLEAGGPLDPEPDSQSPFDSIMPHGTPPAYGRPGVRILRRSGV